MDDTINICLDLLYMDDSDTVHNLTKDQFKRLLLYAVKQNHFMFEGKYYDQIDGVAMGSPLGPVLANIYISHLETNALNDYKDSLPMVYKRYVDDTFLIFENIEASDKFFDYMNTRNDNIKFTRENECNNCISFLDVLVTRDSEGSLSTSVYRKPNFSGLYMKFNSFVPAQFKRSLVHGLLNRAWRICSSEMAFQKEVQFLQNVLMANGFPYHYVKRLVKLFSYRKNNPKTKVETIGPEKKHVIITLPYCGEKSLKLQQQIKRILHKIAPWTRPFIIFKPVLKLNLLSKLKSPIPLLNRSNVVYRLECSDCDEFYIGQTTRRLYKRMKEHKTMEYSSVYKHAFVTDHVINFEGPKILASDNNNVRLKIKESLQIREQCANKSLNVNIQSFECKLW
jgi:hypothetical protein